MELSFRIQGYGFDITLLHLFANILTIIDISLCIPDLEDEDSELGWCGLQKTIPLISWTKILTIKNPDDN